jgi:hypothetical protein
MGEPELPRIEQISGLLQLTPAGLGSQADGSGPIRNRFTAP